MSTTCPDCGIEIVDRPPPPRPWVWYRHCRGDLECVKRQLAQRKVENERLRGIVDPLNRLRAEEGGSVTIYCSTDELCLQNEMVRVVGEWTEWKARDFEGETLAECLAKAEAAQKENG